MEYTNLTKVVSSLFKWPYTSEIIPLVCTVLASYVCTVPSLNLYSGMKRKVPQEDSHAFGTGFENIIQTSLIHRLQSANLFSTQHLYVFLMNLTF